MTADEFVHKWKYGWLRPDHLTAKDSWRDKSLMKADLEEMLKEAKMSAVSFAGPSPNIYL